MALTLEQAHYLVAIHECGSFLKAAERMKRQHSALIHSLRKLENDLGIAVLNRSAYRVALNDAGLRLLHECKRLLAIEAETSALCHELKTGWEPHLKVVIDGILPIDPLLNSFKILDEQKIPTRLSIYTEFHTGVENAFHELKAHLMVSVIAPLKGKFLSKNLPKIKASLVAHKDHPLCAENRTTTIEELRKYNFLTVRGSNPLLNLSTEELDLTSSFHFNDFHSKKQALLSQIGFGWMPNNLIERELKSGRLKPIHWSGRSEHVYSPKIYFLETPRLGKAAQLIVKEWP